MEIGSNLSRRVQGISVFEIYLWFTHSHCFCRKLQDEVLFKHFDLLLVEELMVCVLVAHELVSLWI